MTETSEKPAGRDQSSPPLEFREAWFSYDGVPAVQDATFVVNQGEFVAILGPNGSGKTTLLKMALGLIRPTRGEVRIFGRRPDHFHDWSRVGYVPQSVEAMGARFPATVREVVSFGLYRGFDPLRVFRRGGDENLDRAMQTAGVAELADRRISDISLGQQQRVLIARALVRAPDLLMLDEPAASVDVAGEEGFHALVRHLNRELGMTIVLISHDIGAVMREATTCACINREIVFHGPSHSVDAGTLSRLYGFPVDVMMHDRVHEHR